jgi:hypothetical protein
MFGGRITRFWAPASAVMNELKSEIRSGSPSKETFSRAGSSCELYTAEDNPLEIPCSDSTGAGWCTSRYLAPVPYHLIELAGCYFL